jgi:hypothetical protein
MNVYALTPTGLRPEGLALLGEYINAQTYKGPVTWVIVDDCDPATYIPKMRSGINVILVRPNWRWSPGNSTQIPSMRAGLQKVPKNAVLFVFEDDDIYLTDYMTDMIRAIKDDELIGEEYSRYYNVATGRYKAIKGKVHASLASTVCRGRALQLLKTICNSGITRMLDFTFWKQFDGNKWLMDTSNVVGIKGLPGRPGIGIGHRKKFGSVDINDTLASWAGDYAANYHIFRETK